MICNIFYNFTSGKGNGLKPFIYQLALDVFIRIFRVFKRTGARQITIQYLESIAYGLKKIYLCVRLMLKVWKQKRLLEQ